MVKLIVMAGLALLQASATLAQDAPKPTKAEIKTTPVMKAPANTNTPRTKTAPVSTAPATAPVLTSWDYYLTSAKVTIYTGNDNKELPSDARMHLSFGAGTEQLYTYWVPTWKYKEFAVNSSTEIVLQNTYDTYHLYDPFKLGFAESRGVKLYIFYSPNFPLDAWKIEKVVLSLEFRDGNGNPHPVLGTKSIVFMNIGALLNDGHRGLVCEADQFLMPRTATVIIGK